MAVMQSFAPGYGTGVNVTAGAASANAALPGATSTAACITNSGTVIAFVRTGGSTVTASNADYPVLGGQQVVITINADHTHFAYIAPAGAPTLQVMRGEGF